MNSPIKISFCVFPRAMIQFVAPLLVQWVHDLHYPQVFGPQLCESHTDLHVML